MSDDGNGVVMEMVMAMMQMVMEMMVMVMEMEWWMDGDVW